LLKATVPLLALPPNRKLEAFKHDPGKTRGQKDGFAKKPTGMVDSRLPFRYAL
jgi:hypothetical protein